MYNKCDLIKCDNISMVSSSLARKAEGWALLLTLVYRSVHGAGRLQMLPAILLCRAGDHLDRHMTLTTVYAGLDVSPLRSSMISCQG